MTTAAVAARNARSASPATALTLAEPLATGHAPGASNSAPSWRAHGSDAQDSNGDVREVHPMWKTFGRAAVQPGRQASGTEVREEGCDPAGCEAKKSDAGEAGEVVRCADKAATGGPSADAVGFCLEVEMPIRTYSEANQREHYMAKARRAKAQRRGAYLLLRRLSTFCRPPDEVQIRVCLTRLGVRKLDKDNLAGSFKHIQDGVADWLGIDDGSERVVWEYAQQTGKRYAVLVRIEHS
jgi:hypothetical protein